VRIDKKRAQVMEIKKEIRQLLGSRPKQSHKGDFGRIFIIAGSKGMSGACVLTSQAALRSGAGLVTIGLPKNLVQVVSRRLTESMSKSLPETNAGTLSFKAFRPISEFLKTQDVLAIGPGLSQNSETQRLVRKVTMASQKPMVIDADGLNAFKEHIDLLKKFKAFAILTPHPGEFVRLFGGTLTDSEKLRKARALEVARKYRVAVVLKGHHTIVASPRGESYVNKTGNPGMATGGSGDVLTGIVAAMLGQKKINTFRAACFGVFIHGLAGDLAAKEKGEISLIAGDIVSHLPAAFKAIISA
jgi:NAD(P)H-hydrate epimerase